MGIPTGLYCLITSGIESCDIKNKVEWNINYDYDKYGVYKIGFYQRFGIEGGIRCNPEGLFESICKYHGISPGEFGYDGEIGDDDMWIRSNYWLWCWNQDSDNLRIEENLDNSWETEVR
mgnify:CR=1 FL=1